MPLVGTAVSETELPEEVRNLIRASVPSMDALEILLYLVFNRSRQLTTREISDGLPSVAISESTIREYLTLFRTQGLAVEQQGRFGYQPASATLDAAVSALTAAYNERPVTLIRTVYAIADSKRIQSFADAFKLKKDKEQ